MCAPGLMTVVATFHKTTVSDDGATVRGSNQPVRSLLWEPLMCLESF